MNARVADAVWVVTGMQVRCERVNGGTKGRDVDVLLRDAHATDMTALKRRGCTAVHCTPVANQRESVPR